MMASMKATMQNGVEKMYRECEKANGYEKCMASVKRLTGMKNVWRV
jgi:hypothetical protein